MDVNLDGPFHLTRLAARDMIEQRWGRIVMVSSTAGEVGAAATSAYCAAKHGLLGLMRAVAQDVAPFNVTCNAVCPGWVRTQMAEAHTEHEAKERGMTVEEIWAERAAEYPGRPRRRRGGSRRHDRLPGERGGERRERRGDHRRLGLPLVAAALGIDVGSSAVRAAVLDAEGRLHGRAARPLETASRSPGERSTTRAPGSPERVETGREAVAEAGRGRKSSLWGSALSGLRPCSSTRAVAGAHAGAALRSRSEG